MAIDSKRNSSGASQPKISKEREFGLKVNQQLENYNKILFGEVMTIIETLNLEGKQYNAIKSLLGRAITGNNASLTAIFNNQMLDVFGEDLGDCSVPVLG